MVVSQCDAAVRCERRWRGTQYTALYGANSVASTVRSSCSFLLSCSFSLATTLHLPSRISLFVCVAVCVTTCYVAWRRMGVRFSSDDGAPHTVFSLLLLVCSLSRSRKTSWVGQGISPQQQQGGGEQCAVGCANWLRTVFPNMCFYQSVIPVIGHRP